MLIRQTETGSGTERAIVIDADQEAPEQMTEQTITLTLSRSDAEVLLGVLSSERYNQDAEAVCDAVRKQLDEALRD